MYKKLQIQIKAELDSIKADGLFKTERIITSPQGAIFSLADGRWVVNCCANNYLGLGTSPQIIQSAIEILAVNGYGMGSVRFICGTQAIHKELEKKLSEFPGYRRYDPVCRRPRHQRRSI